MANYTKRDELEGIGSDLMLEPFPAALATRGIEAWLARATQSGYPVPRRSLGESSAQS